MGFPKAKEIPSKLFIELIKKIMNLLRLIKKMADCAVVIKSINDK